MALPPGPRTTLLPNLGFLRDPYGSSLRALARYGDHYTFPSAAGKAVITGEPDGIGPLKRIRLCVLSFFT
jgi:hypothetical protein